MKKRYIPKGMSMEHVQVAIVRARGFERYLKTCKYSNRARNIECETCSASALEASTNCSLYKMMQDEENWKEGDSD